MITLWRRLSDAAERKRRLICHDQRRHREVVETFLRAARAGDREGLLTVLDPDAVLRIDAAGCPAGGTPPLRGRSRGASTWANSSSRSREGLRFVPPAVIRGSVGLILAPGASVLGTNIHLHKTSKSRRSRSLKTLLAVSAISQCFSTGAESKKYGPLAPNIS